MPKFVILVEHSYLVGFVIDAENAVQAKKKYVNLLVDTKPNHQVWNASKVKTIAVTDETTEQYHIDEWKRER